MAVTRLQREFIEHLMLKDQGNMLSDAEWARIAGLDPEVCKGWKKTQEFNAALDRETQRWQHLSPFERRTHLWAIEEAVKNYKSAQRSKAEAEKRHWWKLVMDLTAPAKDDGGTIDYSSYSEQDLWHLIEERGLTEDDFVQAAIQGVK